MTLDPSPPRVLVVVATRHGSTEGIGARIADRLRSRGFEVDVAKADDPPAIDRYGAYVIGSAIYADRWLGPARDFVEHNARRLSARPVWLFSSGPLGDGEADDPVNLHKLTVLSTARDHRVFAGRLDSSDLGLLEKAVVKVVRAEDGDYREWDEIDGWADTIADELTAAVG